MLLINSLRIYELPRSKADEVSKLNLINSKQSFGELTPKRLDELLTKDDADQDFHANSAYTGEDQEKVISKYEMNNQVHEKGYRNKPLTNEQKASNKEKSKTRARVVRLKWMVLWNKA